MEIQGKIAVVTGASRGIGAATAQALANAGAHVILVARSADELEQVSQSIRYAGGKADWLNADLSDTKALELAFQQIIQEFGVPDILINNAGLGRWLFTEETPADEVEMMIKLPYLAAFHATRLVLPGMLARKSGHVVNVNSPASVMVWGASASYAASRWALRGFSESLKLDLFGTGVGISHVVLGEVESSYWDSNAGARQRLPKIAKLIPVLSTARAAHFILKAVRRNQKELTAPTMLWIFRRFLWLSPWLVKWLIRRTSHHR